MHDCINSRPGRGANHSEQGIKLCGGQVRECVCFWLILGVVMMSRDTCLTKHGFHKKNREEVCTMQSPPHLSSCRHIPRAFVRLILSRGVWQARDEEHWCHLGKQAHEIRQIEQEFRCSQSIRRLHNRAKWAKRHITMPKHTQTNAPAASVLKTCPSMAHVAAALRTHSLCSTGPMRFCTGRAT